MVNCSSPTPLWKTIVNATNLAGVDTEYATKRVCPADVEPKMRGMLSLGCKGRSFQDMVIDPTGLWEGRGGSTTEKMLSSVSLPNLGKPWARSVIKVSCVGCAVLEEMKKGGSIMVNEWKQIWERVRICGIEDGVSRRAAAVSGKGNASKTAC